MVMLPIPDDVTVSMVIVAMMPLATAGVCLMARCAVRLIVHAHTVIMLAGWHLRSRMLRCPRLRTHVLLRRAILPCFRTVLKRARLVLALLRQGKRAAHRCHHKSGTEAAERKMLHMTGSLFH